MAKWSHGSKGARKMYQGGASASPEDSLGAKDKFMGPTGQPNAESVANFQDRDKQLDENRANMPNTPQRRTSVGDKEVTYKGGKKVSRG